MGNVRSKFPVGTTIRLRYDVIEQQILVDRNHSSPLLCSEKQQKVPPRGNKPGAPLAVRKFPEKRPCSQSSPTASRRDGVVSFAGDRVGSSGRSPGGAGTGVSAGPATGAGGAHGRPPRATLTARAQAQRPAASSQRARLRCPSLPHSLCSPGGAASQEALKQVI